MHKWPQKTREIQSNHLDSTIWNDFTFRDDDIIIATYAKSGTTWMQQIVSQLIFRGEEHLPVSEMSPWFDMRLPPRDEKLASVNAQNHRRFLKSHLPADALIISPKAKYIYVGRDGRDVLWSFHNHHLHANDHYYERVNDAPGRVGPPFPRPNPDVVAYFRRWLTHDGYPIWSFWDNVRTWWEIRNLPNVHLVHFNDLKRDTPGEVKKIAAFLDIEINPAFLATVLKHSSFDYMKKNAAMIVPRGGAVWEGGAETFMNKGTNGRWRDLLSEDDCAAYERTAVDKLGARCAAWLAGE